MILLLVLVILTYLLILLGLTIWFEKYHYYKNIYFNSASIKSDEIKLNFARSGSESQTNLTQEANHHQEEKRGVKRR